MIVGKHMEHDVLEIRSRGKKVLYRKGDADSNRGHTERQVTPNAPTKICLSHNVIGR